METKDAPIENPLLESQPQVGRRDVCCSFFRCPRTKKGYAVIVGMIGIVCIITISIVVTYATGNKSKSQMKESAQDAHYQDDTSDRVSLLIDQMKCTENTCKECEQNFTVEAIPFEAQECDGQNPKVMNSKCYLCNNTCLTTDDIVDLWNKNMRLCGDSQPEHITCCLISSMENLDKPSLDGTYKCFEAEIHQKYNTSPIQPLFDCQHGKTGKRCEKLNKVPFYCKCYALDNKFHNQENMTECASIPDKPSCHTSIQGRNCMCTRLPEKETRRLTQC